MHQNPLTIIKLSSWSYGSLAKKRKEKLNNSNFIYNHINDLDYKYHKRNLEKIFTNQEVYSLLLRHFLSRSIRLDKLGFAQAFVSVPPNSTSHYKYSVYEALRMANISLKGILESPVAMATTYAFENFHPNSENSTEYIAFFDFGCSQATFSIFSFSQSNEQSHINIHQLALQSNSHLGGDYLDKKIYTFLNQKYLTQKNNQSLYNNSSNKIKLKNLSQRIKEKLGSFKEKNLTFGFSVSTQEILENTNIVDYFTNNLRELIQKGFQEAKITWNNISKIEVVGGGSRLYFLDDILINISQKEKIYHSLNPDKVFAKGAIYASALQDQTTTKKVHFEVFSNTNVSLFLHHSNKKIEIFPKNSYLSNTTIYSFNCSSIQCTNISILSGDDDVELANFFINTSFFNKKMNQNITRTIEIHFGFDENNLPGIYEIKVDNISTNKVVYKSPNWALTHEKLYKIQQLFLEMDSVLKEKLQIQKVRSSLESLIFEKRRLLNENKNFLSVTTKDERQKFHEKLNRTEKLLSDQYLTIKEIKDRIDIIKKLFVDAEYRAEEIEPREKAWKELNESISMVQKSLKTELKEKWVNKTKLQMVKNGLKHAKNWRKVTLTQQCQKQLWEEPVCSAHDIQLQTYYLISTYNFTIRDKFSSQNNKENHYSQYQNFPHIKQITEEDLLNSKDKFTEL